MSHLPSIDDLDVAHKHVLVRVDLNVPMIHGKVSDMTRITRLVPTIEALMKRQAKIIVLSHFGRPNGEFVREMSLAPLTNALSEVLGGKEVKFSLDCIGTATEEAVASLSDGDVLVLENLRFHAEEETNDKAFAASLAKLGDCYVNDTFSCSHRAHASIVGIAELLPSAAGYLLKDEIENLERVLERPKLPLAAIVGGAKISTKLAVLKHLISKVSLLIIGGAMANTFLKAQGYEVGKSLVEDALLDTAREVLANAKQSGCTIVLPHDVVVANALTPSQENKVVAISHVPQESMILDIGPESVADIVGRLSAVSSLVWNGPLGAFEIPPFDHGTIAVARSVAKFASERGLTCVAGGGDIVAAVKHAGLSESFTYISTAGGAFLEWLEGLALPGIDVLRPAEKALKRAGKP